MPDETEAFTERDCRQGFNSKVKPTTSKAYGFRSFEAVETALYHVLGDLPEPEGTHKSSRGGADISVSRFLAWAGFPNQGIIDKLEKLPSINLGFNPDTGTFSLELSTGPSVGLTLGHFPTSGGSVALGVSPPTSTLPITPPTR